ncbi:hypothetical protein Cni_G06301 [Canna indica]|uniref:Uncharacterized protein n=1 Tax=Canna indica TaxID=4628 RepID=A0AAQ3JWS3_9LILI|nr:hypothetical protein Cni_G06301 [Canna indica]
MGWSDSETNDLDDGETPPMLLARVTVTGDAKRSRQVGDLSIPLPAPPSLDFLGVKAASDHAVNVFEGMMATSEALNAKILSFVEAVKKKFAGADVRKHHFRTCKKSTVIRSLVSGFPPSFSRYPKRNDSLVSPVKDAFKGKSCLVKTKESREAPTAYNSNSPGTRDMDTNRSMRSQYYLRISAATWEGINLLCSKGLKVISTGSCDIGDQLLRFIRSYFFGYEADPMVWKIKAMNDGSMLLLCPSTTTKAYLLSWCVMNVQSEFVEFDEWNFAAGRVVTPLQLTAGLSLCSIPRASTKPL